MSELSFYINNTLVPPPDNWPEIEIELSWENMSPDATVRTLLFTWLGSNAALINAAINSGLTGGTGIWEGSPLRIENCSPAVVILNGCVDPTSEETLISCDKVTASVKDLRTIFSDRAESFRFSYLKSIGNITAADYVRVPYVISFIPDYIQVADLALSFIEIVRILKDTWTTLQSLIDKLTGDVTASAATLAATIALVIWDIIVIILYVAYIIFLITLAVNLIILIINNIIQPIKYKFGMKVVDLFTKACSYLGMNFSSTILQSAPYNQLVIIPKKTSLITNPTFTDTFFGNSYARKTYDDAVNSNAYGYYEGTFKQLIEEMSMVFNAKVSIRTVNNVTTLYFERWDHFNQTTTFTLPPISSEAPFVDPVGTNASELDANYYVHYQLDTQDENTLNEYDGTSCQMTLAPTVVNIQQNVLLKGLNDVQLPFARAIRKTSLTVPEQIVNFILGNIASFYNDIVNLINTILSIVGAQTIPTLPTNPFGSRIGAMLLSSDFTGVQKLLVTDANGNVDPNNHAYTDALTLQLNFHSASWAINTQVTPVQHNQYITHKDKEIPLCCADFLTVYNNNMIKTFDQKTGRLYTLAWNPHTQTAKTDFGVKQLYSKNLTQTLITNGD